MFFTPNNFDRMENRIFLKILKNPVFARMVLHIVVINCKTYITSTLANFGKPMQDDKMENSYFSKLLKALIFAFMVLHIDITSSII